VTQVILAPQSKTQIVLANGFRTTLYMGAVLGGAGGGGGALQPPIFFAHGDSTPKLLTTVQAGQRVLELLLTIEVPFNGSGPSLSVGSLADPNLLASAGQSDPSVAATYEFAPGLLFGVDTAIYLFITPGSGSSAGNGSVTFQPE
jgi:hypothetical protein